MGCDIHLIQERLVDGEPVFISSTEYPDEVPGAPTWEPMPYRDRSYALFAVLANVRNYDDCAANEPKGWPEKISETSRLIRDTWSGDAHSLTWFNKAELIAMFEKNPIILRRGLVDDTTLYKWMQTGEPPEMFCRGVSNDTCSLEEGIERVRAAVAAGERLAGALSWKSPHTRLYWHTSFEEIAGRRWKEVVYGLEDNDRLLIFFDN